jgi:hypothetical protein
MISVWYVMSAWGGDGNRSYLEGGLGIDGYHPVELAFVL